MSASGFVMPLLNWKCPKPTGFFGAKDLCPDLGTNIAKRAEITRILSEAPEKLGRKKGDKEEDTWRMGSPTLVSG